MLLAVSACERTDSSASRRCAFPHRLLRGSECGSERGSERGGEQGAALVIALMATTLLMALGGALMLTAMVEVRIAASYREGSEALYAAEAAIARVMQDLLASADWNLILAGGATSTFVDGPASGVRTLEDGSQLELTEATNLWRCGKTTSCSAADMNAANEDRPWGANNPRWQLYAYGPVTGLLSDADIDSRMYVVVWVADDPSETDGTPLIDGGPPVAPATTNPGDGVVAILSQAFGPGGSRRAVRVTVARRDAAGGEGSGKDEPAEGSEEGGPDESGNAGAGVVLPALRLLSWHEMT